LAGRWQVVQRQRAEGKRQKSVKRNRSKEKSGGVSWREVLFGYKNTDNYQ
jgi:hypothetical protein